MSREPYDPESHSAESLDRIAAALESLAERGRPVALAEQPAVEGGHDWRPFPAEWPAERRHVLVAITGTDRGDAPAVAVGYLRIDTSVNRPWFVVPGFGRDFTVTHWSDSLGDFAPPNWVAVGRRQERSR